MATGVVDPILSAQSPRTAEQVSFGLNLSLRLRNPLRMPQLLYQISQRLPEINEALRELHFIHFARFLPTRGGSSLQVITEFDGPFDHYVLDFAISIDEVFDLILRYVANAPPLPIRENPDEFLAFVRRNNRVRICGIPLPGRFNYPVFSAYPERSVIDIVGARTDLPAPVAEPPTCEVDRNDIQANILESYDGRFACHLIYQVKEPQGARRWLSELPVTSAAPWQDKPKAIVNVGLTSAGLQALGVPAEELARLPVAFREGPGQAARARASGDVGAAAPERWVFGSPTGSTVHVMVSVHATDQEALRNRVSVLTEAVPAGSVIEIDCFKAAARNGYREAFGYRDGLSQPRLALGPGSRLHKPCSGPPRSSRMTDLQPAMPVGALLLGAGYPNEFGASSLGSMPPELVTNATFCAVRMLAQDVDAFGTLLDAGARRTGNTPDQVAAGLMGRWRDGTPLALRPVEGVSSPSHADQGVSSRTDMTGGSSRPDGSPPSNAFDYEPSFEHPDTVADPAGLRCPLDAHVRRANPRTSRRSGVRHNHRLVRRGLPYGPLSEKASKAQAQRTDSRTSDGPDESQRGEEGLFGLFLCASLERQFEFVQQQWLRDDIFGGACYRPFGDEGFAQPLEPRRLVTTRGSLYLLMPGLAALRRFGDAPGAGALGTGAGLQRAGFAADPLAGLRSRLAGLMDGIARRILPADPLPAAQTHGLRPSALLPAPGASPVGNGSGKGDGSSNGKGDGSGNGLSAAALGSPGLGPPGLGPPGLGSPGFDPLGFDPLGFDPWTRRFTSDPYPAMRWFRGALPVCHLPKLDGYAVFSKAAVDELLRRDGANGDFTRAELSSPLVRGIFTANEPRHGIIREIVVEALGQAQPQLEQCINDRTKEAIEDARRRGPHIDFVEVIATRIPREVLFDLLGVPGRQRAALDGFARERLLLYGRPGGFLQRINEWRMDLGIARRMLALLCRARLGKATPLVSHLATLTSYTSIAKPPPGRLTLPEAVVSLAQLTMGGYLPMGYLIATGTRSLLLDDARYWQQLCEHPEEVSGAIAEMRRHDTPLATVTRVARRDTSLGGVAIPKGAKVVGFLGSANRDLPLRSDPESFKPGRPDGEQDLSLGKGMRECVGAHLQGQLLPIVFRELLSALPEMRLAHPDAQPPWVETPHFRTFSRLDVTVSSRAAPS